MAPLDFSVCKFIAQKADHIVDRNQDVGKDIEFMGFVKEGLEQAPIRAV
jgi:hypothetical protein